MICHIDGTWGPATTLCTTLSAVFPYLLPCRSAVAEWPKKSFDRGWETLRRPWRRDRDTDALGSTDWRDEHKMDTTTKGIKKKI